MCKVLRHFGEIRWRRLDEWADHQPIVEQATGSTRREAAQETRN